MNEVNNSFNQINNENEKNHDKKKVLSIVLCSVAAVCLILAAYFVVIFVKKQNYIAGIKNIANEYENGILSFDDAMNEIKKYNNETEKAIASARTETETRIKNVKESTENYYQGVEFLKNSNYFEACLKFTQVGEESANYQKSKNKMKEIQPKYLESCLVEAQSYTDNKEFKKAIETIQNYLTYYADDSAQKQIEDIKSKYLDTIFSDSEKFVNNGDYDKAIDILKKYLNDYADETAKSRLVEITDKFRELSLSDANTFAEQKNYSKAVDALNKYLNVDSNKTVQLRLNEIKSEKAKYEKEQKLEKAKANLKISRCWVSSPDSAGGYELHISYTNKSSKTIKYFTFGVSFINKVGDVISTWRIDSVEYCQDVGPIKPGKSSGGYGVYWGKYYDSPIDHPKIVYVEVEYSDGTKWLLDSDEISAVQYK